MNVKKASSLIFQAIVINIACNPIHAQVTLPLYLNPKAVNHLKNTNNRKNKNTEIKPKYEFINRNTQTKPKYEFIKRKNKQAEYTPKNEFKNSVVYASMGMLKESGTRGKRLIKVMKGARLTHLRNVNNRSNSKRLGLRTRTASKTQDGKLNHHYPLFQGFGSHYVTAWVGSPPQRVTLLVDTGSYTTAFPCKGCVECGKEHTDLLYDPDKSTSFQSVSCEQCDGDRGVCDEADDKCIQKVLYLEQSEWEGYTAIDEFFLGPYKKNETTESINEKFTFVCQTSVTGLFKMQLENGIMGLKNSDDQHFPRVLHENNKIPANQFSLCMTEENWTDTDGYHAGFMTLGGVDKTLHTSPMEFASANDYNVRIRSIYLQPAPINKEGSQKNQARGLNLNTVRKIHTADSSIDLSHSVDSGTTITYFSTEYADGFGKEWKSLTGFDFPVDDEAEIDITDEQLSKLPTILVQLVGTDGDNGCYSNQSTKTKLARKLDLKSEHCNDVVISFPSSHYLYKNENGKYSININFEELHIGGGILGANIIQGHDVLFDEENQRIGFAPSKCRFDSD